MTDGNHAEYDSERRYDLDWIRVLAVLLLIPYHTAVIFDRGHVSYIKDQPNAVLETFAHFLYEWHMPLFFLVSGAATWHSLSSRSGGRYIIERIRRLLIPLVFGTLVIIPGMVYCQRLYYQQFSGSYFSFYPHFFNGTYPDGNFSWGHLWFLAYLFVFSVISLPLLLSLRKDIGRRLIRRLASIVERRGAIILLAIPIAVSEAALRARWPNFQNLYDDWANFTLYITVFIYGYILSSDKRFGQAMERDRNILLLLGVISMSTILFFRWRGTLPAPDYSLGWILYMILHGLNSWLWIAAVLGFGRRHMSFTDKKLQYGTEGALPFYILHHAVVVLVGYNMVKLSIGAGWKFLGICAASFVVTALLYDLAVRRMNLTRVLFGLKTK